MDQAQLNDGEQDHAEIIFLCICEANIYIMNNFFPYDVIIRTI